MPKRDPIAVALSDTHIRYQTPRARSLEPSWEAVMARHWNEIRNVAGELEVPVIHAGDLFHKWNTPPETINFALTIIPPMYAVPGQHDMPHHRSSDLSDSAYWTCVMAERVMHLDGPETIEIHGHEIVLYPFGWGSSLLPLARKKTDRRIHIAVVHESIYLTQEHAGVSESQLVTGWGSRLSGYDFAVFGDNHGGFLAKVGGCQVINCGGMIPTNTDQRNKPTGYAVLYSDGTTERRWFDSSEDLWTPDYKSALRDEKESSAVRSIVQALSEFSDMDLNFERTCEATLQAAGSTISEEGQDYIRSVLQDEVKS